MERDICVQTHTGTYLGILANGSVIQTQYCGVWEMLRIIPFDRPVDSSNFSMCRFSVQTVNTNTTHSLHGTTDGDQEEVLLFHLVLLTNDTVLFRSMKTYRPPLSSMQSLYLNMIKQGNGSYIIDYGMFLERDCYYFTVSPADQHPVPRLFKAQQLQRIIPVAQPVEWEGDLSALKESNQRLVCVCVGLAAMLVISIGMSIVIWCRSQSKLSTLQRESSESHCEKQTKKSECENEEKEWCRSKQLAFILKESVRTKKRAMARKESKYGFADIDRITMGQGGEIGKDISHFTKRALSDVLFNANPEGVTL